MIGTVRFELLGGWWSGCVLVVLGCKGLVGPELGPYPRQGVVLVLINMGSIIRVKAPIVEVIARVRC